MKYKNCSQEKLKVLILSMLVLNLLINPSKIRAQYNYKPYSNATLAEKVYLQLDAKVYTTGNIIWVKCIVANACTHVPSMLSKVLYVELIKPDETIYEKKIIKLNNGIGEGFFNLDKELSQGLYLIRAYTQWNKNFGVRFLFEEYIRVFAPKQKGKGNKYQLSYPVANNSQLVKLQMKTANQRQYSKPIVLNDEYKHTDLQFFPESGEMVHGLSCRVGFKALGSNGMGEMVEGVIIDEHDSVITHFESNTLGMGSFVLDSPDSSKTYFARLVSLSVDHESIVYPLPAVVVIGNALTVRKLGKKMVVCAQSNYMMNDSISVRFSYRGMSFYENTVGLIDGAYKFVLLSNQLPEGVIAFTMFNKQMQTIAERLYFNERPKNRVNIKLSVDKNIYAAREQTQLSMQTTDSLGNPIKTNLSLLVINKKQLGEMQRTRQNILSWFLLDSELKGNIENPGFYFNTDSGRFNDLDALMLTQGWRRYHYSKPFDTLSFKPETSLTVSGKVSRGLLRKKGKKAELTMITFGESKNLYKIEADSLGHFQIELDDEYGEVLKVIIQSARKLKDKSEKNIDCSIVLDHYVSPPVAFKQVKTIGKLDSVIQQFVEEDAERNIIDEKFPLDSGNILIDEVDVKAYKLTRQRKLVLDSYGEPDEVIDGEEIQDKEEKWSYGLYSVLMYNYSDQLEVLGGSNSWINVRGSETTLVVIDGIPVKKYQYRYIPNIPPSQISSVEIIKCANNFNGLYLEVFGRFLRKVSCGSIIAIYTHAGKGFNYINEPTGVITTTIPVFSAPREFYAPKYENLKPDDWYKPDLRGLIHWQPIIITDSVGNASASFYNADNGGEMTVVVEAISENGSIGYQELDYKIEGKEKVILMIE